MSQQTHSVSNNLTHQEIAELQSFVELQTRTGNKMRTVPLSTAEGDHVLALLSQDSEELVCAFGKISDWYCAIDQRSNIIAQTETLDDMTRAVSPLLVS
ncbi:hypothetical protein [Kiloniella sp. b19]|uniref:hypothetical protein n=1 Tax=Kiloniella sp. GXU_MW_B19 TaxID=3141326 RepID=UPI0031CF6896